MYLVKNINWDRCHFLINNLEIFIIHVSIIKMIDICYYLNATILWKKVK
jgi:hypothetical protein